MTISRLLVANRGEIAVRVITACRALGIESVQAFSEADRDSLPVRMADRAVCVGPARASDSYLDERVLVSAAQGTGCDAVHPGYGFLSERPTFAAACEENGIAFVGPSSTTICMMGNKLESRRIAMEHDVPVVPGSTGIRTFEEAAAVVEGIGVPVLLKAAAGGGGRGIRIVNDATELKETFESAVAEGKAAFGDGTLYVERYIRKARHIEVQVLGDQYGHVVHLGERDCSLQRRYQKIVEECPAPRLGDKLRSLVHDSAVLLTKVIEYENAGTVEFIIDEDEEMYYFLEMNTRIQVEHPVTEQVTGLDLVQLQLRLAAGEPLDLHQEDVQFVGHAIECRINAEDPSKQFRPSPGLISQWKPPTGPQVRVDSHCYAGYQVPPFYDSLLAKLIVHGDDRVDAIELMRLALGRFQVVGVETTIPFLSFLMGQDAYRMAQVTTRWVEEHLSDFMPVGDGR